MIEPNKNKILELYKKDIARIAKINATSFEYIHGVRNYIKDILPKLLENEYGRKTTLNSLELYIISKYVKMFRALENNIINSYNESLILNRNLVLNTINRRNIIPIKKINSIPNIKQFSETYKVFTEKSVSLRSAEMAKRVTKIIQDSIKKGYGIEKTSKLLDIEFGYRLPNGTINEITQKALKSGKLSHTNGHFYKTYRIARTESMRMNSITNYANFEEMKSLGYNVRVKLLARLDKRTRRQSMDMDGQVSNENGEFIYPNGERYRLGSINIPPRWGINDRETMYLVFLD